jgi:hypothetical protein
MERVTVTIDTDANVRFLVPTSGESPFIESGTLVRRASHVEPWQPVLRLAFYALRAVFGESGQVAEFTRKWDCRWRVNLSPVNGPVIPIEFANRDMAIAFEIDWLERNFL